jgi:general secretion pathway protein E
MGGEPTHARLDSESPVARVAAVAGGRDDREHEADAGEEAAHVAGIAVAASRDDDPSSPPATHPEPDPMAATGLPDLRNVAPIIDGLSVDYLEYFGVLPVREAAGAIQVATWHDELDPQALDDVKLMFDVPIQIVRLPENDVRRAIRRLYGGDVLSNEARSDGGPGQGLSVVVSPEAALDDLVTLANEAPVIKIVNMVLLEALEARASDVHLESQEDGLRVRYRIDGVLQDVPGPPGSMMAGIISRIKVMADLDIAERRLPQDGRIRLRMHDRQVDVRVSTLPALDGESVVLRLLDKESGRIGLDEIGMAADTLATLEDVISQPNGIVLATGPTGSGKTTTLYAAIDRIRTGREKILTVEDPVEYQLPGVPQVQVNEKIGLTFASALRSFLRQDPDILLVGEIRDRETAEIAIHAALTGHLVLSTLHTNDAATALTRLTDLGIAPFLIASSVKAVLAQRLVRVACRVCSAPSAARFAAADTMPSDNGRHRADPACAGCRGTGFFGRTGIYELLVVNDRIRALLPNRPSASVLMHAAVEHGMRTLREDGMRRVAEGVTSVSEIQRVTGGGVTR